ncbi:hypothetical protein ABN224_16235 [Providencia rettgeri]
MIIPKATFLHYKYNKAKNENIYSIKQEIQRIIGVIVTSLRNPDLHAIGEIIHFFPYEQCKQLCHKGNTSFLEDLLSDFELAGYDVEANIEAEGIFIHLSWKRPELLK